MRINKKLIITAVLLAATCVQAAVYKCVSAGSVIFSDQPCASGQTASIIKTPPPAAEVTPASKPAAPAMSPEATAHEAKRREAQAQSNASHARIDAATNQITSIRAANADPAKCAEAKARMAAMEARDPLLYKLDVRYFEFQQAASLHCGN